MNEKILNEIATYIENMINLSKEFSTITQQERNYILLMRISGYLDRLIEEKNISRLHKNVIIKDLMQELNNL